VLVSDASDVGGATVPFVSVSWGCCSHLYGCWFCVIAGLLTMLTVGCSPVVVD
jgi:hypothetical protein